MRAVVEGTKVLLFPETTGDVTAIEMIFGKSGTRTERVDAVARVVDMSETFADGTRKCQVQISFKKA